MYLKHYKLKVKPFEITSDPKFLWFGEKHTEAYAVLRYGVLENKGFLLLTGDIGVGKTTLIAALVKELSDDIIYTTISDPGMTAMDFYRYLAHGFGLDASFFTKAEFLILFRAFLHESYEKGKNVLLIIDEAQRMGQKLLEDVRLLSNVEKDGVKLITIFFVGQKEFLDLLTAPIARALRQRITVSYTIEPLGLRETYRYIAERLRKAGAQTNCFTKAAIEEIHMYSNGAPRMINILCDMAMVLGYSKGVTRLEKQTIRDSARKLPGITTPIKKNSKTNGGVTHVALQERVGGLFDEKITEDTPEKRFSGYLFWVMFTILTVFFAIGMSWLHVAGEAGFLHHSTIGEGAVASQMSPGVLQGARLTYPVTLYFEKESGVMDSRSVPLVQAVVSSLKQDSESLVLIRGFADAMPDDIANLKTSLAKAKFVKHRLIAAGIAEERLYAYGYGASGGDGAKQLGGDSAARLFVVVDLKR